jgi:hypothetical protein
MLCRCCSCKFQGKYVSKGLTENENIAILMKKRERPHWEIWSSCPVKGLQRAHRNNLLKELSTRDSSSIPREGMKLRTALYLSKEDS